ncbi:MAG TPA: peptidylprolyl isomerase [Steroidobacteraceae bacterium]|nr:peptidylprolyl isomerase [Steroidobacteraceae bacterium]
MTLRIFLSVLALALAWPNPADAQTRDLSSQGVLLDRIAAVVNDGIVLLSELETETDLIVARLREQNTELPPRNVLERQVLERLVMQEIQMQRADRIGIRVSDDMLNNALNEVAQRNGIAFSDLPRALEAQGVDYREYRETVRKDLTLSMLRQRDVIARINVSPRELDQYLAQQAAAPDKNAEYNLSHILISVPVAATAEEVAERERRAQDVYERARSGEDFAQLAITYSDSTTNVEGGQLGWRSGPQLPSFVAEVVPAMQQGSVTEPLRTPSGFHVFKLNEVRGLEQAAVVEQVHARHILLQPNELEDDQTVRQKLETIRKRVLDGEDFGAIASVTSADPGSAAQGGDLGWTGPGTFVPVFEEQLAALEVDEISEPFQTQYGWHIVQLLGRRTYDMTDDVRRNRAFAALREAKAEEETELWLRRLRDEAFVDYRM